MIKIYKIFVNIIFVIIIALLLIYILFRMTDKVEIYRVKTGSMEERIHVGDYILIYRKDNYEVGEIVTYTSNDGFITHRIIKKDGNKVVTKGDANNTEDREILASTIVGKTIIIGGMLNIIINYKYVIIGVLLSLYLFSCYFGDDDKTKEEKENKIKETIEEEKTEEVKANNEISDDKALKDENRKQETNQDSEKIEENKDIKDVVEEKVDEIEVKEKSEEVEKIKESIENDDETLIKKKKQKK